MSKFEDYAERVISSLDPFKEKIRSSCSEVFSSDITGDLIKVSIDDLSQLPSLNDGLGEELTADIEGGIVISGVETLAFYKSIHHKSELPFKGQWGIFIFDYSLKYLSHEIAEYYPDKFSDEEALEKAFFLLYYHEIFHFRFDCWVISHESSTKKPLYIKYKHYVYNRYTPSEHEFIREESLANIYCLASIKRHGVFDYAKKFMLCQPGAYSKVIDVDVFEYNAELASQLFNGDPMLSRLLGESTYLFEHAPYLANPDDGLLLDKDCPVYIIQDSLLSGDMLPNVPLPTVLEIEKKYLKKYLNGMEKRTDHKYFVIDNGKKVKCTNPHNKNIKMHEFDNIIKKSGLTAREFFDERKKTNKWKNGWPRKNPLPSRI